MRVMLVAGALLAALLPVARLSASTPVSTIHLSSTVVRPGQAVSVTVTARNLQGRPLWGARASAIVRYSGHMYRAPMRRTNRSGVTILRVKAPAGISNGYVTVSVSVTNGYISIPLTARFQVRLASATSSPTPGATPARTRTPTATASGTRTATPTRTPAGTAHPTSTPKPSGTTHPTSTPKPSGTTHPTSTPKPSPTPAPSSTGIVVVARAVPLPVTPPNPLWIVAYVHTKSGSDLAAASVHAQIHFQETTLTGVGVTDTNGSASIAIDTSGIHESQTASLLVTASWNADSSTTTSDVAVTAAAPTSTPTPTAMPTAAPTPTAAPLAATATATATPPAAGAVPTQQAVATALPTSTPVPTFTPIPTSTPIPTATGTPTPIPTATPVPGCPGSMQSCMQAMLGILNDTRAQYGVGPLVLNQTQSMGTGSCIGSYGHSVHMAEDLHQIAHDQFPADICVAIFPVGENVGQGRSGDELKDLHIMHTLMMSEQHDAAYCASYNNHACNILDPEYHQVGIGLYTSSDGTTWMTQNFLG